MPKKRNNIDINLENIDDINNFLNKIVQDIVSNQRYGTGNGPSVYSFNIRLDRNDVPVVRSVQGVNPQQSAASSRQKEPLIDIIEKKDYVILIAEMQGIGKNKIALIASAASVRITSSDANRVYDRIVTLPSGVDPKSAAARYNNGILEITFRKARYEGKEIKIQIR